MEEIKSIVKKYREVDDQIREFNSLTNDLREQRKILELELTDFLRTNAYSNVNKLINSEDNSYIKVQRPETWTKPWNLSKGDLSFLLKDYFKNDQKAEECFKFIVDNHKQNLVGKEFSYTRVVSKENVNNE